MVKALAQAFRWRKMLDEMCPGRSRSWRSASASIAATWAGCCGLTLLAPEIEAILDGPAQLQLDDLLEGFPLEWEAQRAHWQFGPSTGLRE